MLDTGWGQVYPGFQIKQRGKDKADEKTPEKILNPFLTVITKFTTLFPISRLT